MQVAHLQETVELHKAALASQAAEVERLNLLFTKLRRMQFGRKSEKLDRQIEQLELRLEDPQACEGAARIEIPKTPPTAPERPQREPLPSAKRWRRCFGTARLPTLSPRPRRGTLCAAPIFSAQDW
jgi:hypothetical protein